MKKQIVLKYVSSFLAANLLFQIFSPTLVWALAGGPSQPEVQSFEPVGTTEMVDLTTGDFNYNIPLMDVEGYPINIAYHSGINMEQEASWVGLGWNINAGVINRNMRGLPDDFRGDADKVKKYEYTKPNVTIGVNFGIGSELFGKKLEGKKFKVSVNASAGIFYNNYKGMGTELSLGPDFSIGRIVKYNLGGALSSNSQEGLGLRYHQSVSISSGIETKNNGVSFGIGTSTSINSRTGLKTTSVNPSLSMWVKNSNSKTETNPKKIINSTSSLGTISTGASHVDYAYSTNIPSSTSSYAGSNMMFNYKYGIKFPAGVDGFLEGSGYYSEQHCKYDDYVSHPAYGYMYAHNRAGDQSLSDYVKEKEGVFSKSNPYLPLVNHTYDLNIISGQGIGGMFRAYRTDLGIVSNNQATTSSSGGSLGFENGLGNILKWGVNINGIFSSSKSGEWGDVNLKNKIGFSAVSGSSLFPTPYYFKQTGEKIRVNEDFFAYRNLNDVLRPALSGYNETMLANVDLNNMIKNDGDESNGGTKVQLSNTLKTKKDYINQNINIVTAGQHSGCFIDNSIEIIPLNTSVEEYLSSTRLNKQYLPRLEDNIRKSNHISEISTVSTTGDIYVYSIPAYNLLQREISFTVKPENYSCEDGTVTFNADYITSKHGKQDEGYDAYYNETILPPYAHSYLLTSVYSPDYVDRGNWGLDDDDLGTATKFNYTRITGIQNNEVNSGNYAWRAPMSKEQNRAQHNKMLNADVYDDKGSVVYGEKEVWYLHNIESKNFIAVFYISARKDALGAASVFGGIATNSGGKSYKLDRIVLYNKKDVKENGMSGCTPIKEVLFTYNYELTPGVYNNTDNTDKGKLTLKKITFKYGRSNKGMLSSYEFNYNSPSLAYNPKAIDRWGTLSSLTSCGSTQIQPLDGNWPLSYDFPYTIQNKLNADNNAAAWNLSEIKLPSGGKITVTYEADDYAYVQNKTAMIMCRVAGFSNNGSSPTNMLYSLRDERNWVHIKLTNECKTAEEFLGNYLPDPKDAQDQSRYLYFNFKTRVRHSKSIYENVRGYAEIDFKPANELNNFIKRVSDFEYAVKVKSVTSDDDDDDSYDPTASPFAKTAWQYFRLNLPQYVYPGSNKLKNDEPDLYSITGFIGQIGELMIGVNDRLLLSRFADEVDLSGSFVRIKQGTGFKYGGGLRVKKIEIEDGWNAMTSEPSSSYGQEYSYTTNENGRTISSGVASYEPAIGGEENPFKQPVFTKKENLMIPDETFFVEEPFGESLFPSPGVTYSKVVVKNIKPTSQPLTKHATGYNVHEFYTTKDFPVITKRTSVKSVHQNPSIGDWLKSFIKFEQRNNVTVSQGYQIELNDMNGKPKSESVYSEPIGNMPEKLISKKEYFYKTDVNNPQKLSNQVDVINSDGVIVNDVMVGVESDMVFETNYQQHTMKNAGLQLNFLTELYGIALTWLPIPIPSYREENSKYGTISSTRVIYRFGILDKTVVWEDNAKITQTNLAFDEKTGDVLYSKVTNEFDDPIYNITYPAHWVYTGMDQASRTEGLTFTATITQPEPGYYRITPITNGDWNYFKELHANDLLEVTYNGSKSVVRYMVYEDFAWNIVGGYFVLNPNQTNTCTVKVIRSGRDNTASLPVFKASTLSPPLTFHNSTVSVMGLNATHKVIQAMGTEYYNLWQIDCEKAVSRFEKINEYSATELIKFLNDAFVDDNFIPEILSEINPGRWGSGSSLLLGHKNSEGDYVINPERRTSPFFYNGYRVSSSITSNHIYFSKKVDNSVSPSTITTYYSIWWTNFGFLLKHDYNSSCHDVGPPKSITLIKDNSYFDGDLVKGNLEVELEYGGSCNKIQGVISFINQGDLTDFSPQNPPLPTPRYIGQEFCMNKLSSDFYKYYGNWRKKRDYLYLSNRIPATSANTNQRTDGSFETFSPLWVNSTPNDNTIENYIIPKTGVANWKWTSDITKYSNTGKPIEAVDPLSNYSAVFYDKKGLAVITAQNARLNQVGFENFEKMASSTDACYDEHWQFRFVHVENQEVGVSHTGFGAVKVTSYRIPENYYSISYCEGGTTSTEPCPGCNSVFSPTLGKTYVIMGWARIAPDGNVIRSDINSTVKIHFGKADFLTGVPIKPHGPIIEGWQRFVGEFTVPFNATQVSVRLLPAQVNGADVTTWYDDVRIQPKGALLKSFVYHPYTNRLMAELDENNYATFYEYDEQGALKRVKKETERGIMTIKEVRNHTPKR